MKLGTISYEEKIYNLEYLSSEEINDLLKKVVTNRKTDFENVKKILSNDGEEKNNENKANLFQSFIKHSNENIKVEAVVERALADKITSENVNQKVKNQVNSIKYGIKKINSKFTENSKNYDIVKEQILDCITRYEDTLRKIGDFFDGKIEQLIVRKLELQTDLIGLYSRQQYLANLKNAKNKERNSEKIKNIFTMGIKKAIDRIKERRLKEAIDVKDIIALQDKTEIEQERQDNMENYFENVENEDKNNKQLIEKVNKEIYLTTTEIQRLNDRKKNLINDAMEEEEKWLVTKIKKPKTFERITRFFSSRINTPKLIKKSILDPLNARIDEFMENELSRIGE